MRSWLTWSAVLLGTLALAVNAAAAAVYFYDAAQAHTVALGVTIAGIDVGGLSEGKARARLERELVPRLRRPLALTWRGRRFVVDPQRAGLAVDVDRMVADAVAAGRTGSLLERFARDIRNRRLHAAIPLRAAYSPASVQRFVRNVARNVDRPARSARVVANALAVRVIASRPGVAVRRDALAAELERRLLDPRGGRTLAIPTRAVPPHVSTAQLPHRYPAFITVSRETFRLRLFRGLRLVKTYPIAVGRAGLETPAGLYKIDDKQVNPSWHVPKSPWAGDLAGRVIPPGPDDPIKSRWLGFYNGAGIHGTDNVGSLGSAASHGCIRMSIPDVEELYNLVPYGTPIYIG
jgi:L,D-transpeptidase catalytic domain/Putative peptidoglycan binding domain